MYYREHIKNPSVTLPKTLDELSHVWHLFVVRVNDRDRFQRYLNEKDIQTLVHYPVPPHKQLAYSEWRNVSLSITEKIHQEVISLPISPVMTQADIEYIVGVINEYN